MSEPTGRTFPQNLPRLYAVVDVDLARSRAIDPRVLASAYVSGGARLLQLRAKSLGSGAFLDLARGVVTDAHRAGARVVINDRPDIARLAEADGVHVGQDDLPPEAARRVHDFRILGVSTHTSEQFRAALGSPASYIAVGPVFGSLTKATGYQAIGVSFVRWASSASDRPIVAIGGITLSTAGEVILAGASSVAVISDLLSGTDPVARVGEFVRQLGPE